MTRLRRGGAHNPTVYLCLRRTCLSTLAAWQDKDSHCPRRMCHLASTRPSLINQQDREKDRNRAYLGDRREADGGVYLIWRRRAILIFINHAPPHEV